MKLSELKSELEKRSLPITGSRMALEVRLKGALTMEKPKQESPPPVPDYLRPMGSSFAFGHQVQREQVEPVVVTRGRMADSRPQPPLSSSLGNEDCEMSSDETLESTMYPPKGDFLPLPQTDKRAARSTGIHARLSGRPCAPGIPHPGDAGRMSVFKRLRDVRSDEGVSVVDADVFNEEKKLARAKRFRQDTNLGNSGRSRNSSINISGGSKPRFATTSNRFVGGPSVSAAPPLVEIYQEYDIDKMEDRAEKFSDVHTLKRRARRFDEETADELVQPKQAAKKNDRFKRFKLGDAESSSEDDDDELEKFLAEEQ